MFEPSKLADLLEDRATARKVEPAPFSLPHLIAWLETKPADAEYEYTDPGVCALAQYARAHGVTAEDWWRVVPHCEGLFGKDNTWEERIAGVQPYAFGAMLSRARAYQAGMS